MKGKEDFDSFHGRISVGLGNNVLTAGLLFVLQFSPGSTLLEHGTRAIFVVGNSGCLILFIVLCLVSKGRVVVGGRV
ncbi:hypothetical protein LINGRAHAP2_LOCUS2658 [Linum grandiflorum]